MKAFAYSANPSRVVFGAGTLDEVRAEVERLGGTRVLLLASERLTDRARRALGPLPVAEFADAAMHTPVEVTARALAVLREHDTDCLMAVGGGSAIGLSKALAVRTGLPQVVVPTTYAGSEVTPVLGETEDGRKTTRSDPAILPETVVYDVDLTVDMPLDLTVTSAVNALAHGVEALYAPQANPITDGLALDAVTRIGRALRRVVADPSDVDTRADLLLGAWLAGTCLGAVGMGLHHKLCHTLGGAFGLPHARTHTVVLPHAMAYNASAVPAVMAGIADALGVPDAPSGVFDLIAATGVPTALRELGLAADELPHAVELATSSAYPNPREVTADGVADLLDEAWHGRRPAKAS